MAVCEFRPPSRTPWSLCQEPKTARFPRIARLSPGPRRVGPPCARERRVAGSTTRTAGSSRSRGEGRKCADAGKVLAAADLGTASPSASLEVTSVPTTPVMWWPEAVRLSAVLVVSLWALHLSTLCVCPRPRRADGCRDPLGCPGAAPSGGGPPPEPQRGSLPVGHRQR